MAKTRFVSNTIRQTLPSVKMYNVNNIALFTTDPLIKGVNSFEVCNSLRSVAEFFGTNTNTYKMATAMFSQVRKFIDGDGSLYIIPFNGVSATSSTITTKNLTDNIPAIKSVSDGKVKFIIDGTDYDINNLNFNNITNLKDVASIIQSKISESVLKIEVIESNTKLKFSSLKVGLNSALEIEASSLTGTDLLDTTYLDSATFVETAGANASGETLKSACERILALPMGQKPKFESLITTLRFELDYTENSYFKNLTSYLAGIEKIFTYTYSSVNDNANALLLKNASLTNIRLLIHKPSEVLEFTGATVSYLFSNKLSIANNSLTLNKKPLTGITPTLYWTEGEEESFKNYGVDYYIDDDGTPAYYSTTSHGGAFDGIYNLKFVDLTMTETLSNALNTTTKIPQTQAGITFICSKMRGTLISFRDNGVIALNGNIEWASTDMPQNISVKTFQDIMKTQGFYIEVPDISKQSQVDREQRLAPNIPYYVQFAGAVHRLFATGIIQQ
jgi:hypothetical protein